MPETQPPLTLLLALTALSPVAAQADDPVNDAERIRMTSLSDFENGTFACCSQVIVTNSSALVG